MAEMLRHLVTDLQEKDAVVSFQGTMTKLGISGKILDVEVKQTKAKITEETQSAVYYRDNINKLASCPICGGKLDPTKSVSYDHITAVRDGGTGDIENVQLAHPFCNHGYKESQSATCPEED